MNIILSALVGGLAAAAAAGLIWLIGKQLRWGTQTQRIGQVVGIVAALGAVRLLPIADWALALQPQSQVSESIDRQLAATPPYDVLKESYPNEYEAILDEAAASVRAGDSAQESINKIRPRLLGVFYRQIPKASDPQINRLLTLAVQQAAFLRGQNPRYCHELLNTPTAISFDPASVFPRAMATEELDIMADILRETADAPQATFPPLNEQTMSDIAERAYAALTPAEAQSLIDLNFEVANATSDAQKAAACHFALTMLEEIRSLPPADAALTFRQTFAASAS